MTDFRLDFVVIGSRKSASTWLYELFLRHAEVCVSPVVKQSGFFGRHHEKGLAWYQCLFVDCRAGQLVGEVDPDLISTPEAPERIRRLFPDAKLIAIFRNPADHFYSSYDHARGKGQVAATPEAAWNDEPRFRRELQYGTMMERVYASFPAERVLILFYEHIERDPYAVLTQVSRFLGIRNDFDRELIGTRVNASWSSRSVFFASLLTRGARLARRFDLHRLVDAVKTVPLIRRNYRVKDRGAVQSERQGALRATISADVADELRLFEKLTGQEVARIWPEVAPALSR